MSRRDAPLPDTPYKGLMPYSEEDAPFFFGREAEREIITANLLASRLTLFYGASGVGKSSVLRAGVAYHLHQVAQQNLAERGTPEFAVVVFSSWRDDPLAGLVDHVRGSVARALSGQAFEPVPPSPALAQTLQAWTERVGGDLLIILDQFEEYFLYHPQEDGKGTFAVEFPRAVNRPDLRVNFLISIREDSLAKLDRFKGRIPNLFDNYLRIEHLDREAARAAIEKPVEQYNRLRATDGGQVSVEPALVEAVLEQVRTGQVVLGEAGRGAVEVGPAPTQIETPYLQLVMTRLWEEEMRAGSSVLRLETLNRLGGAEQIVKRHLDAALSGLPPGEQKAAARVFHHLVTPSGTKIAHTVPDLAEYAELVEGQVAPVLDKLSGAEVRILRPVPGGRYEIFHDVLAPAVLDWRARYVQAQERAEAEKQLAREQRRVTRLFLGLIGLSLLLMVMVALAVFAFQQRSRAEEQACLALVRQLAAQAELERNDPRGCCTLAGLLAVESVQRLPNPEANMTLHRLLGVLAQPVARMEHKQSVNVIVLSPDGRRVVSGSEDGTARVWEVDTGREVARAEHAGKVNAVAFSSDGQWVGSGSEDGIARVWEATTGREVAHKEHVEGVSTVAFGPYSQLVVSGSHDGTIFVWEADTGREVARMEHQGLSTLALSSDGRWVASGEGCPPAEACPATVRVWDVATGKEVTRIAHEDGVLDVAFSPDNQWVASGSADQTVRVWEADTGEELARLKHYGRVYAVSFSSDGQWIISGSDDLKARVWEIATGQEVTVMRGHGGTAIVEAVLSSDGRWAVTGSNDCTARVWNVSTGEEVARIEHEGEVTAVAFGRDDQWVVSGSRDATVGVWNVSAMLNEKRVMGREVARMAHEGWMRVVTISPDRRWAVSGGDDGVIRVWDIGDVSDTRLAIGREMGQMEGKVQVVAYSLDGDWLISGSEDGTVQVWEAETGREVSKVKHAGGVNAVAFGPDGQRAASGSGDGMVLVWEIATGREVASMNHGWEVNSVAFTPGGQQVVSVSRNGTALFWDVATGREVKRGEYLSPLTAVALSTDGQWVVSGRDDGTVQVWEAATGREVAQMKHDLKVLAVAFSDDGRWVMTSSYDGTARVWEAISGREVSRIEHAGWADNVAFSRDGQLVVTISYNTAWVWWWKPEDLIAQVCGKLSRNMTSEEWQRYIGDEPYRKTCPELPVPEE